MTELIRVELISRLGFGLLPALATRCKQNIYFALFVVYFKSIILCYIVNTQEETTL